jgi:Na+/melibiose symporter-like transporter
MSYSGYQADAGAQSAGALQSIVLLFTVIPGVGYLITAGVVRLLKVDRNLMTQIQSDLEKRRVNYQELAEYREQQLEAKHS